MNRLFLAAVIGLAFAISRAPLAQTPQTGQVPAPVANDETARINKWFEAKFEEQLAFSPIQQTFLGRKTGKIDDFSIAEQDKQLAWQRASVAEMKKLFDYSKLSPEAQTSYDVWAYQLMQAERAVPFRDNAYIFEQMNAVHGFFPQLLIAFHSVEDAADMENYINRISESARALRQLLVLSKHNATEGVRPPKFSYGFVIDASTKIITGVPFDDSGKDSDVWADVQAKIAALQKKGAIDDARAKTMLAAARTALTGPFKAAYAELIAWEKEDMAKAPDKTLGVNALPNGAAYYKERLANQTTTEMTADEIHKIGLSEVARLRAEMMAIKDEVGFKGDLPAFFKELRDNKDNPLHYYPDTDEGRQAYLKDATAAIDKIKAVLPQFFGLLPKADLVVK
ncbi:MAG TPA: DUF885 domain-containing protein, partial [Vicinamibacterales bacterium]|nr:DUF885 domain-containing protein [Vicinamibacterales bacterium]